MEFPPDDCVVELFIQSFVAAVEEVPPDFAIRLPLHTLQAGKSLAAGRQCGFYGLRRTRDTAKIRPRRRNRGQIQKGEIPGPIRMYRRMAEYATL